MSYELLVLLTNLGILLPNFFHIWAVTNIVSVSTVTDSSLRDENLDKFCLAQIPEKIFFKSMMLYNYIRCLSIYSWHEAILYARFCKTEFFAYNFIQEMIRNKNCHRIACSFLLGQLKCLLGFFHKMLSEIFHMSFSFTISMPPMADTFRV